MNFRDDSSSDELSDGEISKLLIVTQTPNRPKKHEGFDRTGDFLSRVKMTQDLGMVSQIHRNSFFPIEISRKTDKILF